jgi:hypothetical protein
MQSCLNLRELYLLLEIMTFSEKIYLAFPNHVSRIQSTVDVFSLRKLLSLPYMLFSYEYPFKLMNLNTILYLQFINQIFCKNNAHSILMFITGHLL